MIKAGQIRHFCEAGGWPFPIRRVSVGFRSLARGRNVAIEHVSEDASWVLYLDDDVILSPTYLSELLNGAERYPSAKIVFGVIDDLWRSPEVFNIFARMTGLPYHGPGAGYRVQSSFKNTMDTDVREDMRSDWATGCGFMVDKRVFETTQFDGNLTTYSLNEDMDFSFRVSKRYPDSVWCIARARLRHMEAPANRLAQSRLALMRTLYHIYLFRKNRALDGVSTTAFIVSEFAYTAAIFVASLIRYKGNPYPLGAHIYSYWAAWVYRKDLRAGDLTRINELFD
ncbi:MAG: glycosyltransferase family 2 protein [Bacillota bacterium]